MENKSFCDKPNCNCNKSHVYKDILSSIPVKQAHEKFDQVQQEVKDYTKKIFCHLHVHGPASILDGVSGPEEYIKKAKEYNHPAIAITDHGNMSGTLDFWDRCKKAGIKPIIGCELYMNDNINDMEDKKYEGNNTHQIVWIMNEEGYKNLNHLLYLSFTDGFYRRGRVRTEWLFEYNRGLFISTSCIAHKMARYIHEDKNEKAEEYFMELKKVFDDRMVGEIQLNELDRQKIYNSFIIKMCNKYNVPIILTNDVHYANEDGAVLQDTLIAINQKKKLGEAFKLDTRNLYYASAANLHDFNKKYGYKYPEKFIDHCLENTLRVAERCNFNFDKETEKLPKYVPEIDVVDYFKTKDTKEIINKLAKGKLKQKLKEYKANKIVEITPEKEKEYSNRLEYELRIIEEKNTLDYFMVYWELIRHYKKKGFTIGPGRGCFVRGSLVKVDKDKSTPIEKIKIGDIVIDAFGNKQEVQNTFEYSVKEEIIELEFEKNIKIQCTKDHKFLTKNRGWIKACELTEIDDICEV